MPGVVRVLTAAGRARAERRRREARRAAVPDRGHVLRARGLLGARRDAGGGPAGRGQRSRSTTSRCPRWSACTTRSRPGASRATSRTVSRGDAAAGLERAAHRFSGELEIGGQEHFYLETQAALALVDENGQIFVQSSTQHPSETQDIVAHVLGLPAHQVTVQCLRMGGGFGGKEIPAARPGRGRRARRARSPGARCSLRLNRTQDITMTGKRHPFLATWEVGLRRGQAAVRAAAPR